MPVIDIQKWPYMQPNRDLQRLPKRRKRKRKARKIFLPTHMGWIAHKNEMKNV